MSSMIQLEKEVKPALSAPQKTFNRLQKKIRTLQNKLQILHKELDTCLLFYNHQLQPMKKAVVQALQEFVKIIYKHYKNPKDFSKKERRTLKEILTNKLEEIFSLILPSEADPEICAIFKDLEGFSYEEVASEDFNEMKESVREMFLEQGIDLDLSTVEIDATDDEYTIMQKMFKTMRAAMESKKDEPPPVPPKNAKQLQKELKAQELEALQKKGLSGIYKQLAKIFHPDLEQDPEQKIEKEKLMKSLTTAYENGDLHTILSLEMHWMSRSGDRSKEQSDDQLVIYNSILKDQIETLQESIEMAPLHPRYFSMQRHLNNVLDNKMFVLEMYHRELKMDQQYLQALVENLQSTEAMNFLRAILSEATYP